MQLSSPSASIWSWLRACSTEVKLTSVQSSQMHHSRETYVSPARTSMFLQAMMFMGSTRRAYHGLIDAVFIDPERRIAPMEEPERLWATPESFAHFCSASSCQEWLRKTSMCSPRFGLLVSPYVWMPSAELEAMSSAVTAAPSSDRMRTIKEGIEASDIVKGAVNEPIKTKGTNTPKTNIRSPVGCGHPRTCRGLRPADLWWSSTALPTRSWLCRIGES